jgi:hypothetical protein
VAQAVASTVLSIPRAGCTVGAAQIVHMAPCIPERARRCSCRLDGCVAAGAQQPRKRRWAEEQSAGCRCRRVDLRGARERESTGERGVRRAALFPAFLGD